MQSSWFKSKKPMTAFCDHGLLNDSAFYLCFNLLYRAFLQNPAIAPCMAAKARGQKPRLRHDDRHGIFAYFTNQEVTLVHRLPSFELTGGM
jgi:hypothetical protein